MRTRDFLLREANRFVRAASTIEGVERVALIGSLLTDKDEPKDIDLLVTIARTADIRALAHTGRKLKGKCQSQGVGADIFLCNREGQYLGRTCNYRECHPRMTCLGGQCHLGTMINDDFEEIRLSSDLIRNPGLIMWTAVCKSAPVPEDVEQILVNQNDRSAA